MLMNVIDLSDWLKSPTLLPDSVLTIGNFDGVHLGHQAMLDKAKRTQKLTIASAVMPKAKIIPQYQALHV